MYRVGAPEMRAVGRVRQRRLLTFARGQLRVLLMCIGQGRFNFNTAEHSCSRGV